MAEEAQRRFRPKKSSFVERDHGGERLSFGGRIRQPELMFLPGYSQNEMIAVGRQMTRA